MVSWNGMNTSPPRARVVGMVLSEAAKYCRKVSSLALSSADSVAYSPFGTSRSKKSSARILAWSSVKRPVFSESRTCATRSMCV